MRIRAIELRQLELPMIEPLSAAYGSVGHRKTVLVRVLTDMGDGWGECVALNEPIYTEDWSDGEFAVLRDFLVPAALRAPEPTAENLLDHLQLFKQHNPAKAALEMAVLDAELRAAGVSLAAHWGVKEKSVECAVVVGLLEGRSLVAAVQRQLDRGYRHVKLKIAPGCDIERVDLLRREFPGTTLRVDANGSYDWNDEDHRRVLGALDDRELALIEQPLPPDEPLQYRELTGRMKTPIVLDESVTSVGRVRLAIQMQTCDAITLKPGLIGGYVTARRLHDLCLREGLSCSIGGMLETGLARAANLALAGLPGARSFPAEIAPDGRWFPDVINVDPVDIRDGRIAIPDVPGIGASVDPEVLERLTRRVHVVGID